MQRGGRGGRGRGNNRFNSNFHAGGDRFQGKQYDG